MSRLIRLLRRLTPRNDERGIVAIIPLLLLLAGLGAGLYLVQNPQIFRPKASTTEVQLILKSNDASSCAEVKNIGGVDREVVTCTEVKLKLLSPLEKKTSDAGFQLVKTAYARHGPEKSDRYCKDNKVHISDFYENTFTDKMVAFFGGYHSFIEDCSTKAGGEYICDPEAPLPENSSLTSFAACVLKASSVPPPAPAPEPPPPADGDGPKKLSSPSVGTPLCISENYTGERIVISWVPDSDLDGTVFIRLNNKYYQKNVSSGSYSVSGPFSNVSSINQQDPFLQIQPDTTYSVFRTDTNTVGSAYAKAGNTLTSDAVEFSIPKCAEDDKPAGGQEPEEIKPESPNEGDQPRNYSPVGSLTLSPTQNTVPFLWYGAKGAKKYRVMIDDVPKSGKKSAAGGCAGYDNYFCTDRVSNINGIAGSDGVQETGKFDLMLGNTPLEVGTTYRWWVDALDENGKPVSNNATSVGKTFTVIGQPVVVPPAGPAAVVADVLKPILCPKHDGESYPQCGNTIGLEGKDPTHVYTVIPQFDCNNRPAGFKHEDGGVSADCQKPAETPAAAGSPALPGGTADCTTGPVGTISEQIASCVIEKGPSNLIEFYRQNGWCVESEAHKRMLVNDWYSKLAPQADKDRVASCFPGAAPGVTRTTKGFRISESAGNVGSTPLIPYQEGQGGVDYTYPLSSSANGPYYLYIVFYDQDEKAINLTPYTLALVKESPASGNPVAPFVPAPPPPSSVDACKLDCNSCPSKTDKCGNTVYTGTCDYSTCTGPGATYRCTSSSNNNCRGEYECGISCIGTSNSATPPPPPAASDACKLSCGSCPSKVDKCGNNVYQGTCDYSTCTGPGATYRCTSSSNNNCSGYYECGISCIGTSNSPTSPTPPPPPSRGIFDDGYENPDD